MSDRIIDTQSQSLPMDHPAPDPLSGYSLILTLAVQWGDQDAFQHVNNTVYFRWFESARIAYSGKIGILAMMQSQQVGPILASTSCNYRSPVIFPDNVRIGIRVARIGRTSLTLEHAVHSEAQNAIVAEGTSTSVLFDYGANQPCPIPDEIRAAIKLMEDRSSPSVPPS